MPPPKGTLKGWFYRHQLAASIIAFVLIFTLIYCLIDGYSDETNFNGIEESEKDHILPKLYYSTVTQSTVGYGDISPKSRGVRIVSMIQILSTVLLASYFASYLDTELVDGKKGEMGALF